MSYQQGWDEALLILKEKRQDSELSSFAYWEGRMDALNLIKKRIWIKNPEVKGGGFFQEREVRPTERRSSQRLKQALASIDEGRDLLSSIPSAPSDRVRPLQNEESLRARLREIDQESEIKDRAGNIKDKDKQESTETFGQIKSKWGDLPELSPTHEYEPHENPEVEKSLQAFSQKNRFNDFETLEFIDEDTGAVKLSKGGEQFSVDISSKEQKLGEWGVSIHNHPTTADPKHLKLTDENINQGNFPHYLLGDSFSNADLMLSLKTNQNEMRVSALGYDYVMKFPKPETTVYPNGRSKKERILETDLMEYSSDKPNDMALYANVELQSVIASANRDIQRNLIPQLQKKYGEQSIVVQLGDREIYCFDYAHEVMTRVAKELGWEYKKMRNNVPDSKIKEELLRRYGDKQND